MKQNAFFSPARLEPQAIADAFQGIAATTSVWRLPFPGVSVNGGEFKASVSISRGMTKSLLLPEDELASIEAILPKHYYYSVFFIWIEDINRLIPSLDVPEPFLILNHYRKRYTLQEVREQIAKGEDWFNVRRFSGLRSPLTRSLFFFPLRRSFFALGATKDRSMLDACHSKPWRRMVRCSMFSTTPSSAPLSATSAACPSKP